MSWEIFRERWSTRHSKLDGSLSKREDADLAARLARKAQEDGTAVREFAANRQISDGIIGFHAQQAIEKWLKAAMALHGIREARIP